MGMRLRDAASRLDAWRLLPAAFFTMAPALIVRLKYIPVAPDAIAMWDTPLVGDTRSWWKAVFVVGAAVWMLFHIVIGLAAGRKPKARRWTMLLAAAALAVLASAVLSPFPRTAWLGSTAYYEGGLVLLSYLVAMWYSAEMTASDRERLLLLRLMGAVALLNGVIALLEGFGEGFWQSGLGHWLMGAERGGVSFFFSSTGMVSGTVYQPNHYGMLMAMLSMLAVGMLWLEEKKWWRVFWTVAFILGMVGVVYSFSRAAMIAVAAVLAGAAVIGMIKKRRGADKAGAFFPFRMRVPALIGAGLLLVFLAMGGAGRIGAVLDSMAKRTREWARRGAQQYAVKSVDLRGNQITVSLQNGELTLKKASANTWAARRSTDTSDANDWVPMTPGREQDGWAPLSVPESGVHVSYNKKSGMAMLSAPGAKVQFQTVGQEIFALDYHQRLYDALTSPAALDVGGFSSMFSGRGYIWSRSLPLVARHPWLGSGPGTYALVFPGPDLLGKQRYFFNEDVDKGHGIWVTYLVQLGIAGFLLYLLPVAHAVCAGWRRSGRRVIPPLLAVSAYLIGAITNDSTVGVTPIFCMLLGMLATEPEDEPPEPIAAQATVPGRREKTKGKKIQRRGEARS